MRILGNKTLEKDIDRLAVLLNFWKRDSDTVIHTPANVVIDGKVYTVDITDYSSLSTITGFSAYTTKQIYYMTLGKLVFVKFNLVGTSNTTTLNFTLPFTASSVTFNVGEVRVEDNGVFQTGPGMWSLNGSSTTLSVWLTWQGSGGTAWTASGTKAAQGSFMYWAA